MPDNRAKYIATVLQAVILGAVTYYGVKWLVDAMDPTKKSRLAAQKQVGSCVMHEAGSLFISWSKERVILTIPGLLFTYFSVLLRTICLKPRKDRIPCCNMLNRIYNRTLDRDWFSARLFHVIGARSHGCPITGGWFEVFVIGYPHDMDQYQCLGNCAPTPPLTQHVIIS